LHRAFSELTIKSADDERREIEGTASTPEVDRVGDIVVSEGLRFKNPAPLLLYHKHDKPVGRVWFDKPTKHGVKFRAHIPKIDEAGALKERVDEAWQSVKHGLLKWVSIGFNPDEDAIDFIDTGFKFNKAELLELSLVSVPANRSATVDQVRSYVKALDDTATGVEPSPVNPNPSGVTEKPRAAVKASPPKRHMKKTTAEQINAFEATRAAKSARMTELMEAAADKGETLGEAEAQEYDGLEAEVKSVDEHLVRLNALQKAQAEAAKPAVPNTQRQVINANPVITVQEQTPPGIGLARMAIASSAAWLRRQQGSMASAVDVAKAYWPSDSRVHAALQQKETILGGTSVHATNAGPLVDQTNLSSEFIEFLRPRTILGQFGQGNVPSLRRVPFNIRYVEQTSGGNGYWVGEGASKPLTGYDFSASTLLYTKVAAIAVITQELARFSSPSAEALVRDSLADSLRERLDKDFVDPGVAAVTAVSPASITNGITPLTSAGTSADNIRTDLQNLFEAFVVANLDPTSAVLIMPQTLALAASMLVNDLGQPEFPGITMRGGTLMGIPVIASQYAQDASGGAGNLVVLVNASDIFLADDGAVTVDVSTEASLQMSNSPTGNSATATAVSLVSMFQTNSIALRAERFINWKRRRTSSVAFIDDVNWGSVGSPTAA
jgi:HK97 family phage major capsid protein/HK97 family phage prohead protease